MPLSLKDDNILPLLFVIAGQQTQLCYESAQHDFQHVEVQIHFSDSDFAGYVDKLGICQVALNRVRQSRCQATLRRPFVQLQ